MFLQIVKQNLLSKFKGKKQTSKPLKKKKLMDRVIFKNEMHICYFFTVDDIFVLRSSGISRKSGALIVI